jgi:oxygen-dependent protoporphyrinogen oxidase
VFLTGRGGLGRLVDALAERLAGAGCAVRTGVAVSGLTRDGAGLTRDGAGWALRLSSGETVTARAVVVACPAPELLRGVSPSTAAELDAVEWASVAMVTLAYRAGDSPAWEGSGFLVPRGERRFITAGSWVGQKWPHLHVPGLVIVRASAGRVDDQRAAALDDDELAAAVHADLAAAMGLRGLPVERRVTRWPSAFPQYEVGHLARIERAERRLSDDAPGIALAGAALRGVGLATCIAGARAAAARTREFLDQVREG